jgi:hypothetical protein
MTTNIDNSQRAAAKIAGWTYLLSFAIDSPMVLFELGVSFWLLFKGLKPGVPNQAQAGVVEPFRS